MRITEIYLTAPEKLTFECILDYFESHVIFLQSCVSFGRKEYILFTSCPDAFVEVEDEAGEHVVALLVHLVLLLLRHVELPEEVEGDHSVNVNNDRQKHHSQHKLLA